jgi:hypothetical protein
MMRWLSLAIFLCIGLAQPLSVVQTISRPGGLLEVRGATVKVPAGAISGSVRFKLERLTILPHPLPKTGVFFIPYASDRRITGIYRLSSNASDFLRSVEIELSVNKPYKLGNPSTVSAVYIWDGKDYMSVQVPSIHETYLQKRNSLELGAGAKGFRSGIVWIALSAPESSLKQACRSLRGDWTGSSCER